MPKFVLTIEDLPDGSARTDLQIDDAGSLDDLLANSSAQNAAILVAQNLRESGVAIPVPVREVPTRDPAAGSDR